jgi:PEP-CTERM motif
MSQRPPSPTPPSSLSVTFNLSQFVPYAGGNIKLASARCFFVHFPLEKRTTHNLVEKGRVMKKLTRVLAVLGFVAATMNALAAEVIPSTIVVDEFGVGTYNGAPLPSGDAPDPFNGGILHLAYLLPYDTTGPFDILLVEPPAGGLSDIFRFVPSTPTAPSLLDGVGGTLLFFYSDGADGLDAPADVPVLPPLTVPSIGTFTETGLLGPGLPGPYTEDGPNGLVFFAIPGGPGSDGNGAGTVYTFISDIPEPGTMTLVGLSIVGLLAISRRKK